MNKAPLILIIPSTQRHGVEFADASISLSNRYSQAIIAGGGMPWVMPCVPEPGFIAEIVRRCDGVLLTGGDDVQTELYALKLPPKLKKTVGPASPERDKLEILLIEEVFRQCKPLLAICRGQQILNVALGGTLVVDIPSQKPDAFQHNRQDRKCSVVHQVSLTPGSCLAKICGGQTVGVNSTHHQAVDRVALPLKVTAASADGIIEALELKQNGKFNLPFLMAVQFHPERLFDRHREFLDLFRSFIRACLGQRKKSV